MYVGDSIGMCVVPWAEPVGLTLVNAVKRGAYGDGGDVESV